MPAAIHNFSIESGSDFQITFRYLDLNQNPIDLTDYCVSFLWRPVDGLGSPKAFSSSENSSLFVNGYNLTLTTSGDIIIAMSAAFTKAINWTNGVYDLYLSQKSPTFAKKFRLSTGTITILPNNFPECATNTAGYCADCESLAYDPTEPELTSTPTPSNGSVPQPTPTPDTNLCDLVCDGLDLYSEMYTGSSITIDDNSASSGTISISDMREIQNIELFVNKLKHQHPQDLAFVLVTPNQDKILLSAHNKILNNNIVNGFNFVISNKAVPGTYINNVANIPYQIPYVNILDKRSSYNFNNETLLADFDHLIGTSPSGDWTLIIKDDDIGTSGSISDWGLVIAYKPPPFTIDEI